MVIINGYGFIAAVISVVGGMVAYSLMGRRDWCVIIGLSCGAAFDLYQRWQHDDEPHPYLHPHAGAHVTFIPFWLLVILLGIYAGLSELRWI